MAAFQRLSGMLPDSVACDVHLEAADHAYRGWKFLAARWQSRRFLSAGTGFLEHGAWDDVLVLAEEFKKSPVAAIYLGGLQRFCTEHKHAVDAASREARVARNRMHQQLRQGLNRMATISTTAPLVGLFGTTIGILDSFGAYIGSASGYISFIAANIANALVTTAAGLLIGVLAAWSYNWRSDRLAACNAEMEIASAELLKYLEQRRGSLL